MMHGNWMVLSGTRKLDRSTVTIQALAKELGKDERVQEPREAAPEMKRSRHVQR
jgi:hypothetical protein